MEAFEVMNNTYNEWLCGMYHTGDITLDKIRADNEYDEEKRYGKFVDYWMLLKPESANCFDEEQDRLVALAEKGADVGAEGTLVEGKSINGRDYEALVDPDTHVKTGKVAVRKDKEAMVNADVVGKFCALAISERFGHAGNVCIEALLTMADIKGRIIDTIGELLNFGREMQHAFLTSDENKNFFDGMNVFKKVKDGFHIEEDVLTNLEQVDNIRIDKLYSVWGAKDQEPFKTQQTSQDARQALASDFRVKAGGQFLKDKRCFKHDTGDQLSRTFYAQNRDLRVRLKNQAAKVLDNMRQRYLKGDGPLVFPQGIGVTSCNERGLICPCVPRKFDVNRRTVGEIENDCPGNCITINAFILFALFADAGSILRIIPVGDVGFSLGLRERSVGCNMCHVLEVSSGHYLSQNHKRIVHEAMMRRIIKVSTVGAAKALMGKNASLFNQFDVRRFGLDGGDIVVGLVYTLRDVDSRLLDQGINVSALEPSANGRYSLIDETLAKWLGLYDAKGLLKRENFFIFLTIRVIPDGDRTRANLERVALTCRVDAAERLLRPDVIFADSQCYEQYIKAVKFISRNRNTRSRWEKRAFVVPIASNNYHDGSLSMNFNTCITLVAKQVSVMIQQP